VERNKIRTRICLYLAQLNRKFPVEVPTQSHHIKPFALKATLLEAIKGLDEGDVAYSKLKLQDALGRAKAVGEETTPIENILKEFERPLEEEVVYTLEELQQKLERINPQKFRILIKDLKRLPEKHQLVFYSCLFENIEKAHYSKLFENVRNTCEHFYQQAEGEEKEILGRIMEKVDGCLQSLNPATQPKPATILSS